MSCIKFKFFSMDNLKNLTEQRNETWYDGEELRIFVKEQHKIQSEDRLANRLIEEKKMTLRELDLKVIQRQVMIDEQASKLQ